MPVLKYVGKTLDVHVSSEQMKNQLSASPVEIDDAGNRKVQKVTDQIADVHEIVARGDDKIRNMTLPP